MLTSEIVDTDALEFVVNYYTEKDCELDGFKLLNTERSGNKIRFEFRRLPKTRETFRKTTFRAKGLTGVKDAAVFTSHEGLELIEGDTLNVTYTLQWKWYGRGGSGDYVVVPGPEPGARLKLELCMAA